HLQSELLSIMTNPYGRVAEWFKAPVLKTGVPARVPWVRIPPLPPKFNNINRLDDVSQEGVAAFVCRLFLCGALPKRHSLLRYDVAPGLFDVAEGFIFGEVSEDRHDLFDDRAGPGKGGAGEMA